MFNFWRPYPLIKPKKSGWYSCTAAHGGGINNPIVIELYFREWDKKWINRRRQAVFDGYKVYESGHAPIEDFRVFSDSECERIDILAWKKPPRLCIWCRKRGKYDE